MTLRRFLPGALLLVLLAGLVASGWSTQSGELKR